MVIFDLLHWNFSNEQPCLVDVLAIVFSSIHCILCKEEWTVFLFVSIESIYKTSNAPNGIPRQWVTTRNVQQLNCNRMFAIKISYNSKCVFLLAIRIEPCLWKDKQRYSTFCAIYLRWENRIFWCIQMYASRK